MADRPRRPKPSAPGEPAPRAAATAAPRAAPSSAPPESFTAVPVWVRALVSALLLFHLTAAWTAPWSMPSTDGVGAPRLARNFRWFFSWYLDATSLADHGYRFFAPDPGFASHLVKYELEMPGGELTEQKVFPNLVQHRPRLLYHRHFMLTEFLNRFYVPDDVAAGATEPWMKEQVAARQRDLARVSGSYAAHLLAVTGAQRVLLYRREHRIPSPTEVEQGRKLDDPTLFRDNFLGYWPREAAAP